MGRQGSCALLRLLWDSGWPLYLSSRRALNLQGEVELTWVMRGVDALRPCWAVARGVPDRGAAP